MTGQILSLNEFKDVDGCLVSIEDFFDIKRIFYIYGVPSNTCRANHACLNSDFLYIAINGSITIELIDKNSKSKLYLLNSKKNILFVKRNTWIRAFDFSNDAVLLVLANGKYDKNSYVCEWENFVEKGKSDKH